MDFKNTKFSLEIFPPKKAGTIETIYDTINKLADLNPSFISVTYGAGGSIINNKTVELVSYIKHNYNINSLAHLTCINSKKEDIDAILEELQLNSITDILALRGDRIPDLDIKNDFNYAYELITYIKEKGNFNIYAACYPEGHVEASSFEEDIIHLKEKVDCGVTALISQLFFDNNFFYAFLDEAQKHNINVPVHAGIMPVTSFKSIIKMTAMCGSTIPHKLAKVLHKYEYDEDGLKKAGIEYSINQINDLINNNVSGIHLYTMNNPVVAKSIVL